MHDYVRILLKMLAYENAYACPAIIVILWPTYFNIYVVPYNVVERIYPGLALSLAILSIAYLAFYLLREVEEGR